MTISDFGTSVGDYNSGLGASEVEALPTPQELAQTCLAHAQGLMGVALMQIFPVIMITSFVIFDDYYLSRSEDYFNNLVSLRWGVFGIGVALFVIGAWMVIQSRIVLPTKTMIKCTNALWPKRVSRKLVLGAGLILLGGYVAIIMTLLSLSDQKLISDNIRNTVVITLNLVISSILIIGAFLRVRQAIKLGIGHSKTELEDPVAKC